MAKFEIEGLAELDATLGQLKLATQKGVLRRVARRALEPMAQRARELAPDDPKTPAPDLHTSIVVSSNQKGGRQSRRTKEGLGWVNAYMGPTAAGYPQAMIQEFGSAKMAPHPYMRPAFDACKDAALAGIKADLATAINKAARRAAKKAGS